MNPFTRKELQQIITRARCSYKTKGTNFEWIRAYERLVDAASCLDAFIARSSVEEKM